MAVSQKLLTNSENSFKMQYERNCRTDLKETAPLQLHKQCQRISSDSAKHCSCFFPFQLRHWFSLGPTEGSCPWNYIREKLKRTPLRAILWEDKDLPLWTNQPPIRHIPRVFRIVKNRERFSNGQSLDDRVGNLKGMFLSECILAKLRCVRLSKEIETWGSLVIRWFHCASWNQANPSPHTGLSRDGCSNWNWSRGDLFTYAVVSAEIVKWSRWITSGWINRSTEAESACAMRNEAIGTVMTRRSILSTTFM